MTSNPDSPERGMTFVQLVQHVIPDLSDAEAEHVLWTRTPYPIERDRDELLPYLVAERKRLAAYGKGAAS